VVSDLDLEDRPENQRNRFSVPAEPASLINGIGAAIGVWAIILPVPYNAALLSVILAVPVALVRKVVAPTLISPGTSAQSDPGAQVGMLFVVPAVAVAVRAGSDLNLLNWGAELECSICVAAILAIPIIMGGIGFTSRPFRACLLLLLMFGYTAGSLAELNDILDVSPAVATPAVVLAKHVSAGKVQMYDLNLGDLADQSQVRDLKVPYSVFAGTRTGDRVCIELRKGWLGFPHYEVDSCSS
jgi:hypothetical protein